MTTEAERTIALARLVNDAENSAYAAELELAATQAELVQLHEVIDGQQRLIAAQNHAAVLAHEVIQRVTAERDHARGLLQAGIVTWAVDPPRGWTN